MEKKTASATTKEDLQTATITGVVIDRSCAADCEDTWNVPVWISFETAGGYKERIWAIAGVRDCNVGTSIACHHPVGATVWLEGQSRNDWAPAEAIDALVLRDEDGDELPNGALELMDWGRVLCDLAEKEALDAWREWRDRTKPNSND